MSRVTPTYFFASLYRDYIAESGVPGDLSISVHDGGVELARPSFVVAAREKDSLGSRKNVTVSLILLTWLQASSAEAALVETQTTREDASQLLQEADDLLQDLSKFQTWLLTLPAERREGWTLLKNPIFDGETPPMREEVRKINYSITLRLQVAWSRSTAA